jgi:hypothetical protein
MQNDVEPAGGARLVGRHDPWHQHREQDAEWNVDQEDRPPGRTHQDTAEHQPGDRTGRQHHPVRGERLRA